MKALWARVTGWVVWRWKLPSYEQLRLRCERAERHLELAERAPNWKADHEREVAYSKEQRRINVELLARCAALENDRTASGLSAAEVERLALLAMAAGKLAADASKVTLHGWKSSSPFTGRPAYTEVEHSMGRLAAAVELMVEGGDVRGVELRAHAARAKQRIGDQATRQ